MRKNWIKNKKYSCPKSYFSLSFKNQQQEIAEDGDLFFELWMGLLDYANKKYKLHPEIEKIEYRLPLDTKIAGEVADKIFAEVSIVDEYISANENLPQEHKEIIASWKRLINGDFVVERHLSRGTIFISISSEDVYQVLGITSSLEELMPSFALPQIMSATLLPFKNVIITSVIFSYSNLSFGKNYIRTFKDIYREAKKTGTIHKKI